jgi:U4/U6.U5 tri-snRNP-associated protein 1
MNVDKEERAEKERNRQMKMLEKMRKKDKKKAKKDKKKNKRSALDESDDEDGASNEAENTTGGNSLLESLEATAVKQEMRKKRRRDGEAVDASSNEAAAAADMGEEPSDEQIMKEKRSKFDRIMEKGKARTDRAFKSTASTKPDSDTAAPLDDEEDDAFLNAALAKARRIQRLKELSGDSSEVKVEAKGENAVLMAIDQMKKVEADAITSNPASESKGGITFENDEMQEFTRALRARENQVKRAPEKSRGVTVSMDKKKKEVAVKEEEGAVEDVDMELLANEMEEDDNDNTNDVNQGGFDATSGAAPIGRGISNFLSMLKQTGEIKQHATREEMRGRAKDKRTYEDYDHLNLKEVVKINTQNAQEKDLELANREIKLEYRDEHGRLLTRKEAYREMCYQFHGHGASKKNQERKMKQIEREREEAQLASRQAGGRVGTLGALKATQKATGKAFIIHKT